MNMNAGKIMLVIGLSIFLHLCLLMVLMVAIPEPGAPARMPVYAGTEERPMTVRIGPAGLWGRPGAGRVTEKPGEAGSTDSKLQSSAAPVIPALPAHDDPEAGQGVHVAEGESHKTEVTLRIVEGSEGARTEKMTPVEAAGSEGAKSKSIPRAGDGASGSTGSPGNAGAGETSVGGNGGGGTSGSGGGAGDSSGANTGGQDGGSGTEAGGAGGSGDHPALVLRRVKQVYPPYSRRNKQAGIATVAGQVRADGSVGQVRVEKSSGYAHLDDAAVAAARQWVFAPAIVGGRAAESTKLIEFNFRLVDDSGAEGNE